jgi:diguanylate cyclase (GGDEF)-like protein
VLAIDVDEFKALNDTLGHPTGDQALRQVAAALQHWTREIDASARVGGDEFAVMLPGAGPGDAMAVAEDLRSTVARSPLQGNVRVTISIGATTSIGPVPTFGELWQAADAAMYEAKRGGGDRVRFRGADEKAGDLAGADVIESPAESSLA